MIARTAAALLALALALRVEAAGVPDGFDDVLVAEGLFHPTALVILPDGRALVAEQEGRIRVVEEGRVLTTPFLTLAVDATIERGLLGLALDPAFPTNGYLYTYYTHPHPTGPRNRVSRFTRSRTNPAVADPASERILLDDIPSAPFHNGGALRFLPDGTLLVAVGDGEDPPSAQSLSALTGKILRLSADGGPAPDNPFTADPTARPEVWAWGLRNAFSLDVDPAGAGVLAGDVGVAHEEEINLLVPGGNYGWPVCEGPCGVPAFREPLHHYNHSQGCAITGAAFAHGLRFPPPLDSGFYFSDFCGRWISRLDEAGQASQLASDLDEGAVALQVGPDGGLWSLAYAAGQVRRLEFFGAGNARPQAVVRVSPSGGPAGVRVTLSAAGSVDPNGDPLSFSWDPGDGTAPRAGATVDHVYVRRGAHRAQVTVDDGRGGRARASALIEVGTPPAPRIALPAAGTAIRAGATVLLQGEATDVEDGTLRGAALAWTVVLHHHPEGDPNHHTHPFVGPLLGETASFAIPDPFHAEDVFLRVHLTASDTDGLQRETHRDLAAAGQEMSARHP